MIPRVLVKKPISVTRSFHFCSCRFMTNTWFVHVLFSADCSMYPLPSLLHFVAKYGLQDLAATIVGLPGADQAYSLPNARGHTPLDLARMHGHTDLYAFLHDYFDTVSDIDQFLNSN